MLAYQFNPGMKLPKHRHAAVTIQLKQVAGQVEVLSKTKNPCACGGGCPRCQAKLKIGQANDAYEQEADQIAEQVMAQSSTTMQRQTDTDEDELLHAKPLVKSITPLLQRQSNEESTWQDAGKAVENPIRQLQNGGQPLSNNERQFFEPRFGLDFSHVLLHSGSQLARKINARAFTLNNHIVFDQGEYAPNTNRGRRLLAHELTHVVQQTRGNKGSSVQAKTIQRQTVPIPVFDEFDPCLTVPKNLPSPLDKLGGQKICGSHAKKLRKLLIKRKAKKQIQCPPGFIPGTAGEYEGTCCKMTGYLTEGHDKVPTTVHNKQNCCEPAQITANSFFPICCPAGTQPDTQRKNCVKIKPPDFKLKPCPEDNATPFLSCACAPRSRINPAKGVCCPVGQEGSSGTCQTPGIKLTTPAAVPHSSGHVILFKQDRPYSGETGATGLNNSLLGNGQMALQQLIKSLIENPSYSVQLFGRASPEGTENYNMVLSKRRVKIILQALQKGGIARSRIIDAKNWSATEGCESVAGGVIACGESGASGPGTRQVLAKVFSTGS